MCALVWGMQLQVQSRPVGKSGVVACISVQVVSVPAEVEKRAAQLIVLMLSIHTK